MCTSNFVLLRRSRLQPLAACLALAFSADVFALSDAADRVAQSGISGSAMHRGDANTFADITALSSEFAPFENAFPTHPTSTLTVKNCDDSGPDSLRDSIASASEGSSIEFDMNAMACSTITLTTGQIDIAVDNLSIVGPGAEGLTIDGGYSSGYYDRILHHTGIGQLSISYLTLTDAKYASNANQAHGGCVYSNGSVRLVGATITACGVIGNGIGAYGGGVWARGVTLLGSTVSGNVVVSDVQGTGGGVGTDADGFSAKYSAIADNAVMSFALVPSGQGGGIFASGQNVVIRNSTISGNKAAFGGGMSAVLSATVVNSTVSANYASRYYGGLDVGAHADIRNSTISFNRQAKIVNAPVGIVAASMQANSSIFAYNTQEDGTMVAELDAGSADGTITGAKNIILTTEAATIPPADTSTGCPRLTPLLDNGGLTRTHAILPGSAGMDVGNNVDSVATDQRGNGFARVVGSDPDIGAYEWSEGSGEVINSSGFENCN